MALIVKNENVQIEDFEVSVSFVNNDEIRQMNKFYRDKDSVTDVLSFPQYDSIEEINSDEGYISLGDIVVSLDKIEKQAEEYHHSFERELLYLATHGMLHLLGFDHINESDKVEMRAGEKKVMEALGFSLENEESD